MTVEKDTCFSDSDMSQEELLYLPVDICPDVFEKHDECIGMGDTIFYASTLSEDAQQKGEVMKYTSCPIHVEKKLKEMGIDYVRQRVEGGINVDQLFFHDPDGFMVEICNCDNLPVVPIVVVVLCSVKLL